MVQAIIDRLEGGFDVTEIHDPAGVGARFAFHFQLDAERMPVQSGAFVTGRHVRQPVGGLDHEDFEDFHGVIVLGLRAADAMSVKDMFPSR